jgi:hypothetical protein
MAVTKKQLKNLKRIKKGEVKNPNGRPKGALSLTNQVKEILREVGEMKDSKGKKIKMTKAKMLAISIITRAIKGNDNMSKLVWNYLDGMPTQDITGKFDVDVSPYTDDQLKTIAKRIAGSDSKRIKKQSD